MSVLLLLLLLRSAVIKLFVARVVTCSLLITQLTAYSNCEMSWFHHLIPKVRRCGDKDVEGVFVLL